MEGTNAELLRRRDELMGMQYLLATEGKACTPGKRAQSGHKPIYDKIALLIAEIDLEFALRVVRRSKSRLWLGQAIRRLKDSAFEHYEFMGFNDPAMRPDECSCGGCPSWDSVNGCWDNCRSIMQCNRMDEESRYLDAEMMDDDHDADWMYEEDGKGSWHPESGDAEVDCPEERWNGGE